MFKFLKKADDSLKDDVSSELRWDPSVSDEKIKVTTADGVVTLRGYVPHYSERLNSEKAALRVGGVRAVADELEVSLCDGSDKSDDEIAHAALLALDWNYSAPDGVKVTVNKGWVKLEGNAEWDFERNAAKESVSTLMGVRGVTNDIKLKSRVKASDVKTKIEEALKRSADREGKNINVTVSGDRVSLSGSVHSLSEIEDARIAAWSAPGVMNVDDSLKIVA
jgi:osmotically-inducible protein OsmY